MPVRSAQLGALHALASHFTRSTEPALVVLPTGVGKTAIAQATPYVLEDVRKALLVVPSRVLRSDAAEGFAKLTELVSTNLLPVVCEKPRVHELRTRPTDWRFASDFDVVVATPHACSPPILERAGLKTPDPDSFDLILVDEGHHVPAVTWQALVDHFNARKVLLTATPYRRDGKPIIGDVAYDYPLARAVEDGAYAPVTLVPVAAAGKTQQQKDRMIATRAVERLRSPEHTKSAILIRAETQDRAEALAVLYSSLGVKTAAVHNRLAPGTVRKRLESLRHGRIKAVAFVGMLGEGFNHPALKIGAYHDKHKSLPPTLQFIGRLARTRTESAAAEVVTVVEDLHADTWQLYQHDAVWEELVPGLADSATEEVIQRKEFAARLPPTPTQIALHEIEPKKKAVVYEVPTSEWTPPFSNEWLQSQGLVEGAPFMGGNVFYAATDPRSRMLLIISAHVEHPRWIRSRTLDAVTYRLHIAIAELPSTIGRSTVTYIFVASDTRTAESTIAGLVGNGLKPRVADPNVVNRCMEAFDFQKYQGVGLRAIGPRGAGRASYRSLLGSEVNAAVQETDTRANRLGHAMGTARSAPGKPRSTVGVSTVNARIFESSYTALSGYVNWIRKLTAIIRENIESSGRVPLIPSLRYEERLVAWPRSPVIGVQLPAEAFLQEALEIPNGPALSRTNATACLTDGVLQIEIWYEGEKLWSGNQHLNGSVYPTSPEVLLESDLVNSGTLSEFLEDYPPTLFFADGSAVTGTLLSPPVPQVAEVDPRILRRLIWRGVDITSERRTAGQGDRPSVQDYVEQILLRSTQTYVVLDDGPGELADYLRIKPNASSVHVTFVHCKASSETVPGLRLRDMIEVLNQAQRSARWIQQGPLLWEEIARRLSSRESTKVLSAGSFGRSQFGQMCERWTVTPPTLEGTIVIAQPGLDIDKLLAASGGTRANAKGVGVVETLMHSSSFIQTAAINLLLLGS